MVMYIPSSFAVTRLLMAPILHTHREIRVACNIKLLVSYLKLKFDDY